MVFKDHKKNDIKHLLT